ncbi:MAG: hypothetical protein IT288_04085 [Bdellovibrionales bacterium]|nr:hypothetical protein [Bdellovibrionales bacterium]
MNTVRSALLLIAGLVLVSGCATSSDTIGTEDLDQNNQAHGAAFLVDAMHVRRPMPGHKDWRPLQFYFKHCTELGEEVYYSKTSYGCTDPF